jgi:hypothetical protein
MPTGEKQGSARSRLAVRETEAHQLHPDLESIIGPQMFGGAHRAARLPHFACMATVGAADAQVKPWRWCFASAHCTRPIT